MGKVLFVTGATKNTGLAIAEKFASKGFDIALTSRRSKDAEETAARIAETYHVKAKGYGLQLIDVADIRRVFADVKKTFGRLDVFVGNSANLGVGQAILSVTEAEYDDVLDTNLKGNFFCCQESARIMKEQKSGAIVLVGSVHYRGAIGGRSLYAASKGGIATLVRNMAFELGEYGIRVNQVVPGAIRTDRWDSLNEEQIARKRLNWPVGVESTGEDVANGVFFLASDEARTISGSDLTIDSGVLTCLLGYKG